MQDQVAIFLGGLTGPAPGDALYVVAPVGNDIRRAVEVYFGDLQFGSGDPVVAGGLANETLMSSVDNIETMIDDLVAVGARDFLVFGGADIGLVPAITQTSPPEVAFLATQLAIAYNAMLDQMLADLPFHVNHLDLFTLLNEIVADPGAFGLANASDSCIIPDTSICADPNSYLFWDGIHLTTAGQMILLDNIREAVPVPATALLLVVGIAGLAYRRRKAA